jgi:hypothetical protein
MVEEYQAKLKKNNEAEAATVTEAMEIVLKKQDMQKNC